MIDSVTAADGVRLDFSYDPSGRLVKVSDPFERQATFSYDTWGNLVECVDMAGYAFQYSYDGLANVRQMNTPQGPWNFLYTRRSEELVGGVGKNSVTVFDPLSQRKRYEWEGHYAITTDWHLHGTPEEELKQTKLYHETLINTSAADVTAGKNTSESAIGQVIAPTGETTNYTYAATTTTGNHTPASRTLAPVAVTDARGQTTSFSYNWQGNLTSTTDPKGHLTRLNYAPNELDVTGVVNANGVNVASATYNAQHQPMSITTEEGTTNYVYTGWGAPQSVTDALGQTNYVYSMPSYLGYSYRLQSVGARRRDAGQPHLRQGGVVPSAPKT